MRKGCQIREMTRADHEEVYGLWRQTEGLCVGDDDEASRIALYLKRNPGLCFVAIAEGEIVGTVLCGHDGRRGILRHLAVKPDWRKQGIGCALVKKTLAALAQQGIKRCNLYVEDYNAGGFRFWEHLGWRRLKDNYRTLETFTKLKP